jgi:hypothetical protein
MLNEHRIVQAPSFEDYENVQQWFQFFQDRYNRPNVGKKFFPVRVTNPKWLGNIHRAIEEFGWAFRYHNSAERIENIDKLMETAPEKHTIIFIKEFWRASKRLERKHVGGSYEQVPKTQNVSTSAQSMIGRFCDNYNYEGDELDPDLRPVHYGDKEAIEAYVEWFKKGCSYLDANYSSTRIKSKDGHVVAKESKVHASNMENLDAIEVPNGEDPNLAPHKRVPCIIPCTPEEIAEIGSRRGDRRHEKIREIIIRHLPDNPEFSETISGSPCIQVSTPKPETKRSYKIHIEDVVNAHTRDTPYGLMDCKDEHKFTTCWQVYIDIKDNHNRLCVLWQKFE